MRSTRYTILLLLTLGCSSKDPVPVPRVSDYLPLKTGAYHLYTVDSVVVVQNVETAYNYELKTVVTDSFPNATGGYTYVLQRFKRISTLSPWTIHGSWSARTNAYEAVINEGNISFVKIAGPLNDGKAWDGNALNVLGGTEKCLDRDSHACDIYSIERFAKSYAPSPDLTFDNTVRIVQNDNEDMIVKQDIRLEIYALNTGLVYRDITALEYCTDAGCVGSRWVTKGLKYKQTIKEYGGL